MSKHLPGQDTRLDNAGCARLNLPCQASTGTGHRLCPVHCRIRPYWIKVPLARRQRLPLALAALVGARRATDAGHAGQGLLIRRAGASRAQPSSSLPVV
jgi:hypothetical protein